jgi:diguanylate cyclase (GGDEF)-like protein
MMKDEAAKEMESSNTGYATDHAAPGMPPVAAETSAGVQDPEMEAGMEKPTIAELRSSADEFNAAFNVALYELESSRKQLEESSIRIDELNESIKITSRSLNEAINEGRKQEEQHSREKEQLDKKIHDAESECDRLNEEVSAQENTLNLRAEEISQLSSRVEEGLKREQQYSREIEQLNQRLHDAESERDHLNEEVYAQENTLNARAEEISQLSSRINEMGDALEQSAVEGRLAQEEFVRERDALAGKLDELEELLEEADSQLKSQQKVLAENEEEITQLNYQIDGLKVEIDAQSESMRLQAESHVNAVDELDARITGISGEMEELQSVYEESRSYVEKLENLNRALHESVISEHTLHKRVLAEKEKAIDIYRSKLEATDASREGQADNAAEKEALETALSELESRLQESDTLNQSLREKVKLTEELETEVGQLRAALLEAGDSSSQEAEHAQNLQFLAELRSQLESSRAMQEELAARLGDYEALNEEVVNLRAAVQQASNDSSALMDAGAMVEQLKSRVNELYSALAKSEEQRIQLQTALPDASLPDHPGGRSVPPPVHNSQSVSLITDRKQFAWHLNNLLSEQDGSAVKQTVMYVLLDNFMRVRDEIGIMNSEEVIDDISGIISSACDADDVISRFDDSAFAVISSDESIDKAREKAESICSSIKTHIFNYTGKSLFTTASISVCPIRENDAGAETVMSRAELACDAVRLSGGDAVLAISAVAENLATQGDNAEHEDIVVKTLSEKRVRMYYQPISCLVGLPDNNYEVLIRIVDETGNIILPGEFFSMAASAGQGELIDRYVIESIMQTLSENPDLKTKMFIKLTSQSVADKGLSGWILEKTKEYWINPEQLVFEIAESIFQQDIRNLSALSRELHEIGCMIAIEHYQMSTHPHRLRHIHADYLKIDASLAGNLSSNSKSQSKVAAIVGVARENNYITIAEGVENPGCLNKLWEMGVNCVQGYFVKQPSMSLNYDFQGIIPAQEENEDEFPGLYS